MSLTHFTPRFLTEAINDIKVPKTPLYDRVFRRREESPAEFVDFEIITGSEKLPKFVARGVEAYVREKQGLKVVTFRIPSIREKKPFKAADILTQRAPGGSIITNPGDLKKAADRKAMAELEDFKRMMNRGKEWMCAQALTGSLSISGEGVDMAIDYGVASSHKPVLAGTAKWDDSAPDIIANIRAWKKLVAKSGYKATDCILGSTAASLFIKNADVKALLNNRNIVAGQMELNSQSDYLGTILGIRFWENDNEYKNDAGADTPYVAATAAIMYAEEAPFKFWHGPVDDFDANFGVFEFFSKTYREQDPSVDWLLVATAPVPVIHNANALVYATVA